MARPYNVGMTDTGTRDSNISMTNKNGVVETKNNLTGTVRYGSTTNPVGTVYYAGEDNQNYLKNKYYGTDGNNNNNNNNNYYYNNSNNTGYSTHEVRTTTDDYVNLLKSLWNQQKEASDAYAKAQYEQYLNEIAQNTEALKNRANLDMAFTDRKIGQRYGGGVYGKGLSQRSRNISNWGNKLADIRRDDATSRNNAFASYNASLANNASTLANAYVNTILPIWTDRQRYLDSLAFNNSHQV